MDSLFVEGIAATVSAVIVFCGSVWLLLALILGPRLAYFVTASVTLAFLLLMGAVWSIGEPLGPVGQLESYNAVGAADTPADIQFGPARDFPDGPGWTEPSPDDEALLEIATASETAATDALEEAIGAGEITAFENTDQAQVDADSTRILERNGIFYGGVRFETPPLAEEDGDPDTPSDTDIEPEGTDGPPEADPGDGTEDGAGGDDIAAAPEERGDNEGDGDEGIDPDAEAFVILEQDPGNQSGLARMITGGFLALFVVHLVGLSWSEKRARRVP